MGSGRKTGHSLYMCEARGLDLAWVSAEKAPFAAILYGQNRDYVGIVKVTTNSGTVYQYDVYPCEGGVWDCERQV